MVDGLRNTMREVAGFKKLYQITSSPSPDAVVGVEIIFSNLASESKKYLYNMIKRRGGQVVGELAENQPLINAESKRVLRNSAIYFGLTYLPSIAGISIISPQFGITIEFFQVLILGLPPAASAFLTRLALELRI